MIGSLVGFTVGSHMLCGKEIFKCLLVHLTVVASRNLEAKCLLRRLSMTIFGFPQDLRLLEDSSAIFVRAGHLIAWALS
jgi:hypothetical protein